MTATIRPETHPANTWTEAQLSDLELAQDLIDTAFSIATRRIYDERAKREPDSVLLSELQRVRMQCEHDRGFLRWHMRDAVAMKVFITKYTETVNRQRWAN
jgi:hypothetical protein